MATVYFVNNGNTPNGDPIIDSSFPVTITEVQAKLRGIMSQRHSKIADINSEDVGSRLCKPLHVVLEIEENEEGMSFFKKVGFHHLDITPEDVRKKLRS